MEQRRKFEAREGRLRAVSPRSFAALTGAVSAPAAVAAGLPSSWCVSASTKHAHTLTSLISGHPNSVRIAAILPLAQDGRDQQSAPCQWREKEAVSHDDQR